MMCPAQRCLRGRSGSARVIAIHVYWMANVLLAASLRLGNVSFNTPSSYFATDAASSTSCDKLKPREALP